MSQIADRAASDKAANAQSAVDMRAGIKTAKGIVTDAKATPAAQYAKAVGGSIASTEVEERRRLHAEDRHRRRDPDARPCAECGE